MLANRESALSLPLDKLEEKGNRHQLPAVVHLTSREGLSSVFVSQVVRPMSLVKARGHDVTLAVLCPVGEFLRSGVRNRWQQRRAEISEHFGLTVRRFPSPPARVRNLWDDASLFATWLKLRFRKSNSVILHCRGTQATQVALRASLRDGRLRVVSDCRGVDAPEFLMIRGYSDLENAPQAVQAEYEARAEQQGHALRSSPAVICVSDAMKNEIVSKWSVEPERIRVVSCSTDVAAGAKATAARETTRRTLGLDGKLVVAYCGSLMAWQMPMQSLAVYKFLASQRPDVHLLAITTHPELMEKAADRAGISKDERTIVSVPHTEVARHLAAADVGLLIRAPSLVNRVASPVKFAEYLSCGVPVVLSEGVGDYSRLVRERRLGCVLPGLAADRRSQELLQALCASLQSSAPAMRERCLATAKADLDWDRMIDGVCGAYEETARAGGPE